MQIVIGTSDHIISRGLCHNLPLVIEREVFSIDGYIFPLANNTDIILGTLWLYSLGPIL